MDRETCDKEVIDANDLMDKLLVHQKAKAKLHHRVSGHLEGWEGITNSKSLLFPWRSRCRSVAQLYLTLWDPMNSSLPGFPILHYAPEFAQTHAH